MLERKKNDCRIVCNQLVEFGSKGFCGTRNFVVVGAFVEISKICFVRFDGLHEGFQMVQDSRKSDAWLLRYEAIFAITFLPIAGEPDVLTKIFFVRFDGRKQLFQTVELDRSTD